MESAKGSAVCEAKVCRLCGQEKARSEFYFNAKKNWFSTECKACNRTAKQAKRAAGYRPPSTSVEYHRAQRRRAAEREGRPFVATSSPAYLTQQAAKQAERRAIHVAIEEAHAAYQFWKSQPRVAAVLVELKAKRAAESQRGYYSRHRANAIGKVVRYKNAYPDRVATYNAVRAERIQTAADGSLTPEAIVEMKRHATHCAYCADAMADHAKQTDHIVALSLGGEHSARNVVICCAWCNGRKASLPFETWLDRVDPKHRPRAVALYRERFGAPIVAPVSPAFARVEGLFDPPPTSATWANVAQATACQ
jgi:5-methylcytosine-specific restriction endonuclease McrA